MSTARHYAHALARLQHTGSSPSTLYENLTRHLEATGRTKLLPAILRELKRLEARGTSRADRIEIASEADRAEALATARSLGIVAEPVIVRSLVSGWRALGKGSLIDRSSKRALLDLYRSITVAP